MPGPGVCDPLQACSGPGSGTLSGDFINLVISNYPGTFSYFYATISGSPSTLIPNGNPTTYPGFCVDPFTEINLNQNYTAIMYCSLNDNWFEISNNLGVMMQRQNINMLNYIINRSIYYTTPVADGGLGFTFGDVQTAVWNTITGTGITNGTAPFDPANVETILEDALMHSRFYKPTNPTDAFAIFIAPVDPSTFELTGQIIVLRVTVAQFSVPCAFTSPSPIPILLPPLVPLVEV